MDRFSIPGGIFEEGMRTIGVIAAEHIAVGLVEDNQVIGELLGFPGAASPGDALVEMPADEIVRRIADQVEMIRAGGEVAAVGVGFPGIIRDGVIDESPNLPQMKGLALGDELTSRLDNAGLRWPVRVINDADAMAAGIAATYGQLDKLVRTWTLGSGIGYGRYPHAPGVWEGGHTVVTLDAKEQFCRCGGAGHLEGIMGDRAMRLRFLDLEPDEVFELAAQGDLRCGTFVRLWHRALAGATATSIHLEGPGKFFVSGPNSRFIQIGLINLFLHEMVKMSPLQGSSIEVVSTSDEMAIIGAGISASRPG
ncbi:MAG: ROK family protein [Acidobacteriota bacterium]